MGGAGIIVRGLSRVAQERIIAVIPAKDAAGTIREVVDGALGQCGRVIVGDDASDDGTGEAACRAGALVIVMPGHMGKGAVLRRLLLEAWELGASAAIALDADGQHDPKDIPKFLDAHARDPEALLVGDRFAGGGRIPWPRLVAQRIASIFIKYAAGCRLADSQCGFRLVPRSLAERCPTRSGGFAMETEFLIAAMAGGFPVRGVPIAAHYGHGQTSQFRPILDFLSIGSVVAACLIARTCLEFAGIKNALPIAARNAGKAWLRWPILVLVPLLIPLLLVAAFCFPGRFPVFGRSRQGVAAFGRDCLRLVGELIRLPLASQDERPS